MVVFNIEIWGEDADRFMALSCPNKKKWIKENTNQQNDALIDEFLKYAVRGTDDECAGCKKAKADASIAKTNAGSVVEPDTVGEDQTENNRVDSARPKPRNKGTQAK